MQQSWSLSLTELISDGSLSSKLGPSSKQMQVLAGEIDLVLLCEVNPPEHQPGLYLQADYWRVSEDLELLDSNSTSVDQVCEIMGYGCAFEIIICVADVMKLLMSQKGCRVDFVASYVTLLGYGAAVGVVGVGGCGG